jgi:2-polyprenyl-3-methyl-5-hydroxy-6-metoxy-1,4-benzoquinol methylase
MAGWNTCNLCRNPGTRLTAVEVARVPCNVRRFQDHSFTLWRCTGCRSIHCEEDADLNLYYADYPLKKQAVGFGERIAYRKRLQLIEQQGFRKSDRILDYGCGAGLFVDFLRQQGVDRAAGYDPFVEAYHDPAPLQQPFDAVVSYDVIEHHEDPRAFIEELTPLVRPGGQLVIGTPNADRVRIDREGDPSLHPPYHRHILSQSVLVELGRQLGLTVLRVYLRSFYDSLYPTVNSRFLWAYLRKSKLLDTAVEPPRTDLVAKSPELLFFALFGYFFPARDYMLVTFRKAG